MASPNHVGLGGIAAIAAAASVIAGCSADPRARSDAFLRQGDRFAARREFRAASIEYRNAAKADPGSAIAHRKLGDAYLGLEQPDKALQAYERALQIDRRDLVSHIRAGSLFLLAGDFERAASHARDAIAVDAKNVDARVLLGNALAGARDVPAAIAQLEEAVALNPSEWRGYSALGDLHWVHGDRAAAEASFSKAIEIAPESARARLAAAQFYWGTSRLDEAEDQLHRAVALDPRGRDANALLAEFYIRTDRVARAEPHLKVLAGLDRSGKFLLAGYYAMAGRLSDAIAIVEPLAAGDDQDGAAAARLAALLYDRGDRAGASARVDGVLRTHRDQPVALVMKSRMAIDDRRWTEARDSAQAVARGGRTSWLASYLVGVAQMGLHEYRAAADAFAEAVRLNPRAPAAYVKRAEALSAAGDGWAAIQSLERAYPDQPAAVGTVANNVAWELLTGGGDERAALTLARYAVDSLKDRPEPLDTLGAIYLRQGEHARAEAMFRASLRLAPGNDTYRAHLAEARKANVAAGAEPAGATIVGPMRPPEPRPPTR